MFNYHPSPYDVDEYEMFHRMPLKNYFYLDLLIYSEDETGIEFDFDDIDTEEKELIAAAFHQYSRIHRLVTLFPLVPFFRSMDNTESDEEELNVIGGYSSIVGFRFITSTELYIHETFDQMSVWSGMFLALFPHLDALFNEFDKLMNLYMIDADVDIGDDTRVKQNLNYIFHFVKHNPNNVCTKLTTGLYHVISGFAISDKLSLSMVGSKKNTKMLHDTLRAIYQTITASVLLTQVTTKRSNKQFQRRDGISHFHLSLPSSRDLYYIDKNTYQKEDKTEKMEKKIRVLGAKAEEHKKEREEALKKRAEAKVATEKTIERAKKPPVKKEDVVPKTNNPNEEPVIDVNIEDLNMHGLQFSTDDGKTHTINATKKENNTEIVSVKKPKETTKKKTETKDGAEEPKKKVTKTPKKKATASKTEEAAKPVETQQEKQADTPKASAIAEDAVPSVERVIAGDRNCYAYFSLLATSGQDLYSVCVLGPDEDMSFYGEFTDFDYSTITTEFIQTFMTDALRPSKIDMSNYSSLETAEASIPRGFWVSGSKEEIATALYLWLDKYYHKVGKKCQFVGDRVYLEFVRLVSLITMRDATICGGKAYPAWIGHTCLDLNQDIALSITNIDDPVDKIPLQIAYDFNRDELFASIAPELAGKLTKKHNAMYFAYTTRAIHQNMWGLAETEK